MIARMWHGRTRREEADAYAAFLAQRAVPDYRGTPGNRGAWVLRRDEADASHFVTLSFWESEAAIRAFAGDDIRRARYYPEDTGFLLEFEREVVHYDIAAPAFGEGHGVR